MTHREVREVMTTDVRSVYLGTPVKVIADHLEAGHVSALPVLNDDATVVGIVSEADLLYKFAHQDDTDTGPRLLRRHHVDQARAQGLTARDLMTAPVRTVSPNASVVQAAALMEQHGVKRLPVVDAEGNLVGIVSRRDLVRLFVRPDEQIRTEVETDVLARALLLPPGTVSAWVANGMVTLRGKVQWRTTAEAAAELTRHTDGVVDVANQLTFVTDDTDYRALQDPMI